MAKIEELLFGYKILRVSRENTTSAVNILLRLGICADVSSSGEIRLGLRDASRFLSSGGRALCIDVSRTGGIPGIAGMVFGRIGILAALIFSFVMYALSSELVWDVRVKGNDRLTQGEVCEQLSESGLHVGSLWRGIDKNKLEAQILSTSKDISWISINRRGSVAYVEIIESEGDNIAVPDNLGAYCNIIADRACVIDSISVTSGTAAVKAGDVVRAGDVLIFGVIESGQGTSFCRAAGEIRGITKAEVEVFVPVSEEMKVYSGERLCEVKLKLFNFYINIFKNYGNLEDGCDIIDDVELCVLFDSYRLPFGITRSYAVQNRTETVSRTKDEMISLARARHSRSLNALLGGGDLLKISSRSDFCEDGYRLSSTVVYSNSVGVEGTPFTDGTQSENGVNND